jgi:hypothetical protein
VEAQQLTPHRRARMPNGAPSYARIFSIANWDAASVSEKI